jgi:dipeptidyl aminopeptidase/acylaminoacyl peptidase
MLWDEAELNFLWTEDSGKVSIFNLRGFRQWLADDRIILSGDLNIYGEEYPTIDEFYVFTPATGAMEHYIIDFFEHFATPPSYPISRKQPLYDPYFKYALYRWEELVLENNIIVSDQDGLLLWDIHSGKEVWRAAGWGWPDVRAGASWKYDGSQVAYVAPDPAHDFSLELFSVSTSGLVSQLTNLGGTNIEYYEIFDLLWSPNGRYIAFLFNKDVIEPLYSRYLYILDLDTGVVTDYCISPVWDMFWSPDSTQIAFLRNILGGPDDPPQLLVLDLEEQIAQDMEIETRGLYGWIGWDLP